jgi:hypothetical protein
LDVVVSRCAGIDIGKSEVVGCLRIPSTRGKRLSEVRTFSAFTKDVERLADPSTKKIRAQPGPPHTMLTPSRRPTGHASLY